METTIQKWGNSQGLRISRTFLAEARLGVGDQVSLEVEGDAIVIRKAPQKKYDLAELVAQIPKGHKAKEEAFGAPVGKEVW
jgi:antitoxin MazE